MESLIRSNLSKRITLSDDEFTRVERNLKVRLLKKKRNLINQGEVCRNIYFVNRGALRTFYVDDSGKEYTNQIAVEDNWISDLYSFTTQSPSVYTIETLEDCELLALAYEDLEALYLQVPSLERFFRILFQNAYVATQRRLNAILSVSAEERYVELIKTSPSIALRIPLIHIASYLGITPESLSRVRKKLAKKI